MISTRWDRTKSQVRTTCREARRPARGYTFLELALALGIVVVVFIAVVPVIASGHVERRLRQGMDELAQAVRESRAEAEKTGAGRMLVVEKNGLSERSGDKVHEKVRTPGNAGLSVRFAQGDWEQEREWRIFSCGLVEPVSLRLQEGRAWIEADFDFLTGSVADERYSF